jgi:ectoine hydroxylase-related dioxygenase (phytanoyl-CoA dioxygenase family)
MSSLTSVQLRSYQDDGFLFPIQVLDEAEARQVRADYEALERSDKDSTSARKWFEYPHAHHAWAYDLMAHPRLLDAVESIVGPDILLWDSKLFPKMPGSTDFVTWHQDRTYAGLDPLELVVTAWIAITDAGPENGSMSYLPGSHKLGQLKHLETHADGNLLSRGQSINDGLDTSKSIGVRLSAGQATFHSLSLVHSSGANMSPHKRVGIMATYLSPRVACSRGDHGSTMLVRGRDTSGNFRLIERPS